MVGSLLPVSTWGLTVGPVVGSLLPVTVDGDLLEGFGVQQGPDLRPGGHLLDQVIEFGEVIQGLGAQNQVVQQQVKQVVVRE